MTAPGALFCNEVVAGYAKEIFGDKIPEHRFIRIDKNFANLCDECGFPSRGTIKFVAYDKENKEVITKVHFDVKFSINPEMAFGQRFIEAEPANLRLELPDGTIFQEPTTQYFLVLFETRMGEQQFDRNRLLKIENCTDEAETGRIADRWAWYQALTMSVYSIGDEHITTVDNVIHLGELTDKMAKKLDRGLYTITGPLGEDWFKTYKEDGFGDWKEHYPEWLQKEILGS